MLSDIPEDKRVTSADIESALKHLDTKHEISTTQHKSFKGMTMFLTAVVRYLIEKSKMHMWPSSQEALTVALVGRDFEAGKITAKAGRKKIRLLNGSGIEKSMTPFQYIIWWYITRDFTT